jgi:hypothetical protein
MSFAQTLMHYKLGHHPMGGKFSAIISIFITLIIPKIISSEDVQTYPFEPVHDFCFSRFGTQFFENPVAGLLL